MGHSSDLPVLLFFFHVYPHSLIDALNGCPLIRRFSPSFAPFVDGTVIVGLDADVNKTMNLPIGSALST